VRLIERSHFPRHKVCGEFLSPGIAPILEQLGVWQTFQAHNPAMVRRMEIYVRGAVKSAQLPEPAFGLSRYAFDRILWESAIAAGVEPASDGEPNVVTTGRTSSSEPRGRRVFGFKAHFTGPADDAVQLFFLGSTYVGINCVENGITNVCGLAREEDLKSVGFDVDTLIHRDAALRARLQPLTPKWDWIFTGPLQYSQRLQPAGNVYRAGDALSFVDPFTGSGLLCAVLTGSMAGESAAQRIPVPDYLQRCASAIHKPFWVSSLLRKLSGSRAAGPLLQAMPARLLFRLTRPPLVTGPR
jgi:2-polyprenyl-6-methoxyphenol hydroxylase-like FAD-dependent oxidoreductase